MASSGQSSSLEQTPGQVQIESCNMTPPPVKRIRCGQPPLTCATMMPQSSPGAEITSSGVNVSANVQLQTTHASASRTCQSSPNRLSQAHLAAEAEHDGDTDRFASPPAKHNHSSATPQSTAWSSRSSIDSPDHPSWTNLLWPDFKDAEDFRRRYSVIADLDSQPMDW